MANATQIDARIIDEILQAAQPTLFQNAPGTLATTFATQDVVVEDGAAHIASKYARVFANDFDTTGVPTNDIRFGYETVAASVFGSVNGPINIEAGGASAELLVVAPDYNNVVNAYNPNGISAGITVFSMYNIIREGVVDADGNQIAQTPEVEGYRWWQEQMDSGVSLQQVAQAFLTYIPGHDTANNMDFVTMMYERILNRTPELDGMSYFLNYLNNAEANGVSMLEARANVLLGFANSQEFLVGHDIGRQALDWSETNGQIMGASLDAFFGAGDDIVFATIGNNTIDAGGGNNQVYLTGYNFGTTNIVGVEGYETISFIDDNAAMRVVGVTVYNNIDGTATVQLQTNWDATINIFTDNFSADQVARSFGSSLPAAGQSASFNGEWSAQQANALLDFDAEERIALESGPVVTPDIVGTENAESLHGTDANNVMAGLGGANQMSGHDGDDRMDFGTSNAPQLGWGGNQNDHMVALGGGPVDLSGEAGRDVLVSKIGSVLRGGEHEDTYVVGVEGAEGERAVIEQLEAWDVAQFFGLQGNEPAELTFFNNAAGMDVIHFSFKNGTSIDAFVDDYTREQFQNRTAAIVDEWGNAHAIRTGAQLNTDFGTSANGEQTVEAGLIGLNPEGKFEYTGWQYHNEIA